jgi:hypothetical protein
MQNFRDLKVWSKAHSVVADVQEVKRMLSGLLARVKTDYSKLKTDD